jgi:AcrR family transcriptional regulator
MTTGHPSKRPGGRSARVDEAVLAAGRELVSTGGTDAVTVAELARLSGVHAASIYRRWGGAPGVVLALATRELQHSAPLPHSGRLYDDLLGYAAGVARSVESADGLDFLRAVVSATDDPAHSPAEALVARGAELQEMLEAAARNGEPRLEFTDVLDGILAPIYFRKLFGVGGIDDAYLRTLVERVLRFGDAAGAAAELRTPTSPPTAQRG